MSSNKGYAVVTVTIKGSQVVCTPEWANCFWNAGPDNIRWVFQNLPSSVASVCIQYMGQVPAKYQQSVPGFQNRPPFSGFGTLPASGGAPLPDLITLGNLQQRGYFCYSIVFFDSGGNVVAQYDPGGTNDPMPPSSPHA